MKTFWMIFKKTKNYIIRMERKIEDNQFNWEIYLIHATEGKFKLAEGLDIFKVKISAGQLYKKISKMGTNKYIESITGKKVGE